MKIMPLLSLFAVCACATPTERGVAAHLRHERNSIQVEQAAPVPLDTAAMIERLHRDNALARAQAQAEAEAACGGAVEFVPPGDPADGGYVPSDYECLPR